MKTIVLCGCIALAIFSACNGPFNQHGNDADAPRVVEVKGFAVSPDSTEIPTFVVAGKPIAIKAGNPKVVLTNTHVVVAGVPEKVNSGAPFEN